MEETINNKVRVLSPGRAAEYNGKNLPKNNRYKWVSLDIVEPNLGIPTPERRGGGLDEFDVVLNSYGLSAVIYPPGYVESLGGTGAPVYEDLKIDINLDFTSLNSTLLVDPSLYGTAQTLSRLLSSSSPLRQLLLPFYNGDEDLLLQNVRINAPGFLQSDIENDYPELIGNLNVPGGVYTEFLIPGLNEEALPTERTLCWAASGLASFNPSTRKIVINLCDESSGLLKYYGEFNRGTDFNPLSALTNEYISDFSTLTGVLKQRKDTNAADTKIFDICVGTGIYSTPWADAYGNFLNHVKNGGGNYNVFNLSEYDEYQIGSVARGATIGYYSNFIMAKLRDAGYFYQGSTLAEKYYVTSDLIGERGFDAFPAAEAAEFSSQERPDLPDLEAAIDELLYVEPQIATFTLNDVNSIYYIEPNTTLTNPQLKWKSNKVTEGAIDRYELTLPDSSVKIFRKIEKYEFKNILLSVSGTGYDNNPPIISTQTVSPLSTFQPATFLPIMNGTNLIGISVINPGEYSTYDINIVFNNGGNTSPVSPTVKTIGLNKQVGAPANSFVLETLSTGSSLNQIITFSLKVVDWAGKSSTSTYQLRTAGYIYYGALDSKLTITPSDIINGTSVLGGLRRIGDSTARSYFINCAPGKFYYIAYPSVVPDPSCVVNGYPVQNEVRSGITMPYEGRPGLSFPYRITISNNRTGGTIPINLF